jgi:hypothetical protein
MFTLEYAKDLSYASADGNSIFMTIKCAEFNDEHRFLAATYDPMPHGVDWYNRAKAGEFGPVAPYVAPPEPTQPVTTGSQTL